ncbi:MAG: hypothetical protein H0W39_00955 [Sphingomonas sp.]|nr:hypothetical protein [Sphingomonas sp.]
MTFESVAPILMIFLRYSISGLGVWLVSKGFSELDANTIVEQAVVLTTGIILSGGPALYAAWKRPSVKAMETAKVVDQQIPKGEDVVLKTPAGVPDIIVHSPEKK